MTDDEAKEFVAGMAHDAMFEAILEAVHLSAEELGVIVRDAWLQWARTRPNPKASWLKSWEDLPPEERIVDRQIGTAVMDAVLLRLIAAGVSVPARNAHSESA